MLIPSTPRLKATFTLVAVSCVLAGVCAAQNFQIGSSNTVTADPPVPRPHTTPCVVPLFTGSQFVDFSVPTYQYTPPSDCPGPWKKVVFTADFSVTAGRQFDRTAIVDMGFVNLYFGTTAEPRHNLAPSWHIERDVTDYSALFTAPQTGAVILGNIVNSIYTGIISGSAALEFYPASEPEDAPRVPDAVYPLRQAKSSGGFNEPAFLFTPADQLASSFTLPTNVEKAYLDVITQSQIGDEFWYTCVPNDVTTELQSCGSTAFREAEISIDGQPTGVAPVYPWIYTGGVDPLFWEPIPGAQTLNFVPYRVDLTPFAGVLSNGQSHTVAMSVFNANNYFTATATLLLYLDHGSSQVTGAVTKNTIGSGPTPSVNENVTTDASGNISGTVTVNSLRSFKVAGYVNTSHGKVDTEVRQKVNFANSQSFVINKTTYTQNVTQNTQVDSTVTTRDMETSRITHEAFRYPLTLDYTLTFNADNTINQAGLASQEFDHDVASPSFSSSLRNRVKSVDTLFLTSSFQITGNTGQKSSQSYSAVDSRGDTYNCTLKAKNNALTSASQGCSHH
jgi:peptide N-acetyl-beta-D-glucosaminyl asparaginase amidase A